MNEPTYSRRNELKTLLDLFTDKLNTVTEIIAVVSDDDKKVWIDKQTDLKNKLHNVEIELGVK